MHRIRPVLAAVLLAASAGAAHAVCPGLDVLIEDGFETLAPTWGEADGRFQVQDSQLIVSPASGTDYWRRSNAGLYDDIDMCVTVTTLSGVDETEARAGVVFWFEDVNNFHVFQIAPNGQASVWRRQRGKWLEQVPWQAIGAANEGDNADNELRVTTVEEDATFYVNGERFAQLSGSPPVRGQQIGIFVGSPVSGRAIFAFDTLRVTRP